MSTAEVDPKIGDPPCEVERNNSRFDAENTESDNNDPVTASERGDGKLETDDSELDSEKSHSDYDFERITEDEAAAAGDGFAEGNKDVPAHDSAKSKIRRRRTQLSGELEAALQGNKETVQQDQLILDYPKDTDSQPQTQKQDQACGCNPEPGSTTVNTATAVPAGSLWTWLMYVVPKATCLIILSLIYLGLILLSIRILNMSPKKT